MSDVSAKRDPNPEWAKVPEDWPDRRLPIPELRWVSK